MADVMPFLRNVTRGRGVPERRLQVVAKHYEMFDGVSPINGQNRALVAALEELFQEKGPDLPVYFGNRNWHPFVSDTLGTMIEDGVKRALVFVTSGFSSYSSCRQYLEDLESARALYGDKAPALEKLRVFYNHPGFVGPMAQSVQAALSVIPSDRRRSARILFTAHSLPLAMAQACNYELQLNESCRLVADLASLAHWELVYQSRSGSPSQPWLGPDVCEQITQLSRSGAVEFVLVPIGFLSDNMEVIYDLGVEAHQVGEELGVKVIRAATVGTHPGFVEMIRQLVLERTDEDSHRGVLGLLGPAPDVCVLDCCPSLGQLKTR